MFKAIKIAWKVFTKGTKEVKEAYLAMLRVKEEGIDVAEAMKKLKGTPSKSTVNDMVKQIKELTEAIDTFADEGKDIIDLFVN